MLEHDDSHVFQECFAPHWPLTWGTIWSCVQYCMLQIVKLGCGLRCGKGQTKSQCSQGVLTVHV